MENHQYVLKFKGIDFAIDSIINSTIYLNRANNFNDPLDSFITQLMGEATRITPFPLRDYINIGKNTGIFCATKIDNLSNVLLWSHYADSHKGLVLKYKVPKNISGKLESVDYDTHSHEAFMDAINYGNPLNLPSSKYEEKEEQVVNSIFLKDSPWEYEKEIRYVKKFDDEHSCFETDWEVTEVYLGCHYLSNSNEDLEEIHKLIDICNDKMIRVYRMKYEYSYNTKRMELKPTEWLSSEMIREVENWSRIRREITEELTKRYSNTYTGKIIKEIIKEVSKEIFDEKMEIEYAKLMRSL